MWKVIWFRKTIKQDQRDPHKIVERNIKKPALEFKRSKKLEVIIRVGIATAVIVSFGVYTVTAPMDPLPQQYMASRAVPLNNCSFMYMLISM